MYAAHEFRIFAILLSLSACSNSSQSPSPQPSVARKFGTLDPHVERDAGNQYSRQLAQMDDQLRRATMRTLLETSGEQCEYATEVMLRGADKNKTAYWNVRCSDSGDWAVAVSKNSATTIFNCAVSTVTKSDCWTPLNAPS